MKRFLAIMMAMVLVLGSAFLFAACDDKNKGGEEEKREVLV